jgi:hypothetical protein
MIVCLGTTPALQRTVTLAGLEVEAVNCALAALWCSPVDSVDALYLLWRQSKAQGAVLGSRLRTEY